MRSIEEDNSRRNALIPVLLLVAACILIIVAYSGYSRVTGLLAEAARDNAIIQKKKGIQASVDNLILDIERQSELLHQLHPRWTDEELEANVTEWLHHKVYEDSYPDDAYFWVIKIHDYGGGKNYATRIIHPNLNDTEGMFLSTDMTDGHGNYIYKQQLKDVQDKGFSIQNYYFPNFHSDVVSAKLSYSRLYKKYDWIIAMGVNIDELNVYADTFYMKVSPEIRGNILYMAGFILGIYLIALLIVTHSDQKFWKRQHKDLLTAVNLDKLTQVSSRRYGEMVLNKEFDHFRKTGYSKTAIMVLDVDKFKHINDCYGHGSGDAVLQNIASGIKESVRTTDTIARWGGDEFVGIFPGLDIENLSILKDKILKRVREIELKDEEGKGIHVTVSIGFTYFKDEDRSYEDAFKRADQALYNSKNLGRDRCSICH